MAALSGRRALVKVVGAPVTFTGEATSTTDHQAYQITNAAKRIWDPATPLTVLVGGIAAAEAYTFNRLNGTVTFAGSDAGRGAVTLSSKYLPTAVAAGAKSYSWSLMATNLDDTDFDSAYANDGVMTRTPALADVSGTIGRNLETTSTYFRDALLASSLVVIVFYSDRTQAPDLTVFAVLSKVNLQSAVAALATSDIDFQGAPDDQGVVAA